MGSHGEVSHFWGGLVDNSLWSGQRKSPCSKPEFFLLKLLPQLWSADGMQEQMLDLLEGPTGRLLYLMKIYSKDLFQLISHIRAIALQ